MKGLRTFKLLFVVIAVHCIIFRFLYFPSKFIVHSENAFQYEASTNFVIRICVFLKLDEPRFNFKIVYLRHILSSLNWQQIKVTIFIYTFPTLLMELDETKRFCFSFIKVSGRKFSKSKNPFFLLFWCEKLDWYLSFNNWVVESNSCWPKTSERTFDWNCEKINFSKLKFPIKTKCSNWKVY